METQIELSREILNAFLEQWPIELVEQMTLNEYVSVGNKDTFCQWLETKTKALGSIKGITSIKFGIYKRKDPNKRPKSYRNDDQYSWQKYYGDSRPEAFKRIKKELLEVIEYASKGQLEKIDKIHLTNFVKWKVAYLYSNERLVPIFKKEVLIKILAHFGIKANFGTPISQAQRTIIANKPSHLSIYEYAESLYQKFGGADYHDKGKKKAKAKKRIRRRASSNKNIKPHIRKGGASYIANQKHNILQEALRKKLISLYSEENVLMEEDFVDLKLTLPELITFYEVKSSSYASDCIREALGQILSYAHYDSDIRPKRLVIVGQYPANDNEIDFIKYIQSNLKVEFKYEHIDLD